MGEALAASWRTVLGVNGVCLCTMLRASAQGFVFGSHMYLCVAYAALCGAETIAHGRGYFPSLTDLSVVILSYESVLYGNSWLAFVVEAHACVFVSTNAQSLIEV